MSYIKKIEYEIVLKDSFLVSRRCPKCGRRTYFKNTGKFRVNANGNKLDVWLIYQCEECKHTLNLAIYERQKVSSIPKEEYLSFLENNEQLAERYGKNPQLFLKNKAEVDFDRIKYEFVKRQEIVESSDTGDQLVFAINNPHQLKIRSEKQVAEILGLSRSQVKSLLEREDIKLEIRQPHFISVRINTGLLHLDD